MIMLIFQFPGAAVIHSKTSPSFRTGKAKFFLYSLPVMDYMRSPELILEPDNHPGNCWPFPGSQGHVFIKLSMPVIPRAITMDHVSGTAFHGESISGAPKDFAVYGFKEEHEEQGTFLGQFTFLAALNPSQTFQLKVWRHRGRGTAGEEEKHGWMGRGFPAKGYRQPCP
ncbi:SUN domain-containing protein 3-like [Columba livia]|uniref:SUN domain-containing protein 3-like n=1 Tax=Columba livia TaxID=8932 RepID=UPI0031BA119A